MNAANCLIFRLGATKMNGGAIKMVNGATKAHSGATKAHSGATKTHSGATKKTLTRVSRARVYETLFLVQLVSPVGSL